jgi:hypothetical protein
MITIAGINVGTKYPAEYTNNWMAGIKRTLKQEHRLHVITDDTLKGWWSKLRLFDPDSPLPEVVYFFDIDVCFLRTLDVVIEALDACQCDIAGLKDYINPGLNSSVMRIRRGSAGAMKVWEFAKKCGFHLTRGGDQDLIWQAAKEHIEFIPENLCPSYKVISGLWRHKTRTPLEEACLLVCHGYPNPPDIIRQKMRYHTLVRRCWRS